MNRKVLIMDDSMVERTVLFGFLKSDYEILTATSGEAGIKLLKNNSEGISAIVLDIIMTGMDGFSVMRAIRR